MTEYEAASLTLQLAAVWVAAIVGAAQCSLIGYGLYIMRQASKQRDALHQETMKALDSQHRETMAALESRHQETMKAMDSRHQENMEALEGQQSALMELIRRTSAPPARQDG